jgi:hypothetical protein
MEPVTRRELLSKSTVLLLLVPVAACSSGSPASSVVQASEDASACDGVFEISTVDNNHDHSLCVPTTDLENPPTTGMTYTTSVNQGHEHTVTLTQAQLQTIDSGMSVTVTTNPPVAYPHNFTIQKA